MKLVAMLPEPEPKAKTLETWPPSAKVIGLTKPGMLEKRAVCLEPQLSEKLSM